MYDIQGWFFQTPWCKSTRRVCKRGTLFRITRPWRKEFVEDKGLGRRGREIRKMGESSPDLSLRLRRGSSDSRDSFYMDFAQVNLTILQLYNIEPHSSETRIQCKLTHSKLVFWFSPHKKYSIPRLCDGIIKFSSSSFTKRIFQRVCTIFQKRWSVGWATLLFLLSFKGNSCTLRKVIFFLYFALYSTRVSTFFITSCQGFFSILFVIRNGGSLKVLNN